MARFSEARWVGTPNYTRGGMMGTPYGWVYHLTAGSMPGCLSWLQNPKSNASAHFINPKSGRLFQLVDTADKAWAQAAGNGHWLSIEHEGEPGDALTESQIANDIALARWGHDVYGIPYTETDDPSGRGFGWHGMGGTAWGGHPNCPGDLIKAARAVIIQRAQAPVTPGEAMSRFPNAVDAKLAPGGGVWVVGSDGGVGCYGGAQFHGSMGGQHLNAPVAALAVHGAGGYWLVGEDGGIFAFGDAPGVAPYQPLFTEFANGDRAIMGAEFDGERLTLIGDDGATYGLSHA